MKGGRRRDGFVSARPSVCSLLFRVSVSIFHVSCARSRCACVKNCNPRSPDPDAETGRAAEGAERMNAWRRRRQRKSGSRILREGSVSRRRFPALFIRKGLLGPPQTPTPPPLPLPPPSVSCLQWREGGEADEKHCHLDTHRLPVWAAVAVLATLALSTSLLKRERHALI